MHDFDSAVDKLYEIIYSFVYIFLYSYQTKLSGIVSQLSFSMEEMKHWNNVPRTYVTQTNVKRKIRGPWNASVCFL